METQHFDNKYLEWWVLGDICCVLIVIFEIKSRSLQVAF